MSDTDDYAHRGKVAKIANSEMFTSIGRISATACIPLLCWLLSNQTDYGKALVKIDQQIVMLTAQVTTMTGRLELEATTRYTATEAAKDLQYRDQQIKGIQEHLINAEHDISELQTRVTRIEPKR